MPNKLPFEQLCRKTIVKREAETNPSYGSRPEARSAEELVDYGVVCVNKPKGPSSHQVSEYVQRILGIKTAGHGGTLDPAVTGVLPVALGRATRIVQALLPAGKEYVGIMHLHKDVSDSELKRAVSSFTGVIKQLPPVKSAVKRELREREVYYFEVLEKCGTDVLFRVGCQAGTYVRKLCHDLGKHLGVGAHMVQLHRTKAGPFSDRQMVTLQELEDAVWYWRNEGNERFLRYCIKPVEYAVSHLPKVWVLDNAVDTLCHGAQLNVPGISKFETGIEKESLVAVMTLKGELVALGTARMSSDELLKAEKGLAVRISKVFMRPGTYGKEQSLNKQ